MEVNIYNLVGARRLGEGVDIQIAPWKGGQARLTEWNIVNNHEIEVRDERGTFADNMKAPIHRWFRFPAGFSYGLVEECISRFKINENHLILDPFVGSGTTSVCAKKIGIDSVGVEAHPLLAWIARVKTYWDFDFEYLRDEIERGLKETREILASSEVESYDLEKKPALLLKVFDRIKLARLYTLRDYIYLISDEHFRDFFTLGLIATLRTVCKAGVGWAYIDIGKERKNLPSVYDAFSKHVHTMYNDLTSVAKMRKRKAVARIEQADTRDMSSFLEDEVIDFAFTSPPYLNNYDYADRTRLEFYFLSPITLAGITYNISTWNELAREVRKKLLVNCSHQAIELGLRENLRPNEEIASSPREKIKQISNELNKRKRLHGGKKDYDIMTMAYFNDMFLTFKELFRLLKPNRYYLLVLGDSAPYSVHIPTDMLLAKIAIGVGFKEAKIRLLRKRGGKWKTAPKHQVPLRESLLILHK